jgi:hypothetical protein
VLFNFVSLPNLLKFFLLNYLGAMPRVPNALRVPNLQVLVLNYMGPMVRMAQEKEKGIKQALLLKGMSPVDFILYSSLLNIFIVTCTIGNYFSQI